MHFRTFTVPNRKTPIYMRHKQDQLSGCSGYIQNYTQVMKKSMPKRPGAQGGCWGLGNYKKSSDVGNFVREMHDEALGGGGRIFMFTGSMSVKYLGKQHTGISKHKIMIGRKMHGVSMTSFSQYVPITDPKRQLPTFVLRPNRTAGLGHLEDSGFLSHKKDYWSEATLKPNKLKRADEQYIMAHTHNRGRPIAKLTLCGIYTANARASSCSTQMWSKEVPELTGIPWWECDRRAGVLPIVPEILVDKVSKTIYKELASHSVTEAMVVAGNLRPSGMLDSNRIISAFSEKSGFRRPDRMPCPYMLVKGKRLYYKLFPMIYRSPQHASHPCGGMMFALKPINFVPIGEV